MPTADMQQPSADDTAAIVQLKVHGRGDLADNQHPVVPIKPKRSLP